MSDPLEPARRLIAWGIPVFACPPGSGPKGYQLPARWQAIEPDLRRLDVWRPGYALAMVCGRGLDVLDVDPRNGGEGSWETLCARGLVPRAYATATTPNGGHHTFIRSLEVAKRTIAPGLDLQAGAPDGSGRGFVFLPPTVALALDGERRPYTWAAEPHAGNSPETIARLTGEFDVTGARLRAWIAEQARERPQTAERGSLGSPIPEGSRDAVLTSYAASLRRKGLERGEAEVLVLARARDCSPPWDGDPLAKVESAWRNLEPVQQGQDWPLIRFRRGTPATARERLGVLDVNDLDTIPPPRPLIDGIADVGTLTILSGKFGTYKTFVALGWAASLARGTGWFGHAAPERRRVVYVAAEGASGVRARLEAWSSAHGGIERGWLEVVPRAVRLNREEELSDLIELAQGAGLIVLDTLHKMTPGVEEASSKEMGLAYEVLDRVRAETGAALLGVHHTGHSGERARGSSAIEDDADFAWVIKLGGEGEDRRPENPRTLTHRKVKDGELRSPRRLEFFPSGNSGWVGAGAVETYLTINATKYEALCSALDALGLPTDTGHPTAAARLRATGEAFDDKALRDVLKVRRQRDHPDFKRPDWMPEWRSEGRRGLKLC